MVSAYSHIEERNGRYYIRDQRVPVTSIAFAWNQGRSPETIAQDFPVLTLAEVYGAITFYLDHRMLIERHVAEDNTSFELARQAQRAADPERYQELERRFAAIRTQEQPSAS